MAKVSRIFSNPWLIYAWATELGLTQFVPDELHLQAMWKSSLGTKSKIDFISPTTFNEKLQWLKLHNRKPLYTTLVDKVAVKEWVAGKVGAKYVIPSLVTWDKPEDIDVSNLPDRFVLKASHDSGGAIVCTAKGGFDVERARASLKRRLKKNYYFYGREWPYKDIRPMAFAEEYIGHSDGTLPSDYKFFCFDGVPHCAMVCLGRETGQTQFYFMDRDWNLLRLNGWGQRAPEGFTPPRPERVGEMFEIAATLSEGIPFVRVDLYCEEGRVLFGEMTFYPDSGWDPNITEEADRLWGSMLRLPDLDATKEGR